jgi:acyl transferase domain-containing protein
VVNHLETDGEPARSSAPAIFKGLMRRMAGELESKLAEGDEAYRDHLLALADLYIKGCQLNWRELYGGEKIRRLAMPKYPFEARRFWVPQKIAASAKNDQPVGGNGHLTVRANGHHELHGAGHVKGNGNGNGNGTIGGNGANYDDERALKLLEDVKAGRLDLDEAVDSLEQRDER